MPSSFLKSLSAAERSESTDFVLACFLAFVAGAINAGGFSAVHAYTSHMSGILSSVADFLVQGRWRVALSAVGALAAFMGGAACTTLIVHWAQRQKLSSAYALPLLCEAVLLLLFGLLGEQLDVQLFSAVSLLVMLLSFLMGMQNALITKISDFRIRTTHVTGMVTDIGIELGRMLTSSVGAGREGESGVHADESNLRLLTLLVGLFFSGGLMGAMGFQLFGLLFTLPLAAALACLALPLVVDDVKNMFAGFSAQA